VNRAAGRRWAGVCSTRPGTARAACLLLGLAVAVTGCTHPSTPHVTEAAIPTSTSMSAATVPQEHSASGRRITLGRKLFQAGSHEFAPGAEVLISHALADVTGGSVLRVEVFAEPPSARPRVPRGTMKRLSQLRADAMAKELLARGYLVERAVGRGYDEVDGRPADRRVDVLVLGEPDRTSTGLPESEANPAGPILPLDVCRDVMICTLYAQQHTSVVVADTARPELRRWANGVTAALNRRSTDEWMLEPSSDGKALIATTPLAKSPDSASILLWPDVSHAEGPVEIKGYSRAVFVSETWVWAQHTQNSILVSRDQPEQSVATPHDARAIAVTGNSLAYIDGQGRLFLQESFANSRTSKQVQLDDARCDRVWPLASGFVLAADITDRQYVVKMDGTVIKQTCECGIIQALGSGNLLVAKNSDDNSVFFGQLDKDGRAIVTRRWRDSGVTPISVSPSGRWMLCKLRVWDPVVDKTDLVIRPAEGEAKPNDVGVDQSGVPGLPKDCNHPIWIAFRSTE
jgi:hypothetical protein